MNEPAPLLVSALVESERVRASDLLEIADVIYKATAAGVAAAGASWNKKSARSASKAYENLLNALSVRAKGVVGKDYDSMGRPIAKSLGEVRDWFVGLGVIG